MKELLNRLITLHLVQIGFANDRLTKYVTLYY